MSVKNDLIAAKALINTPKKWAKTPIAPKRKGEPMCAIRAVEKACKLGITDGYYSPAGEALRAALPVRFRGAGVGAYNDQKGVTHADIMALFDRAIEASP